jgi:poly[ADP-ribose] polymerase 16
MFYDDLLSSLDAMSSPDCLCSILHNGLLAASGTRLQTSGALFGVGIYLSTDFNVAYSFSKSQQGWAGSSIGRHLRCVLLCEVDAEVAQQGQSNGTAQGNSSSRCGLLPA